MKVDSRVTSTERTPLLQSGAPSLLVEPASERPDCVDDNSKEGNTSFLGILSILLVGETLGNSPSPPCIVLKSCRRIHCQRRHFTSPRNLRPDRL